MKHFLPLILLVLYPLNDSVAAPTAPTPQDIFLRLDKNQDGKITKDELPSERHDQFLRLDKNADGHISPQEHQNFIARPIQSQSERVIALPENVKGKLDLNYAGNSNPRQALDLYLPVQPEGKETPLPVIIFIHGGGWQSGSKRSGDKDWLPYVASGQYAVASIGYRLTSEAQWPAQLHDCKAAIRWLRANAKEHGLDPAHMGVWGMSAGAFLANIVGTSGDVPKLEGNIGSHLGYKSHVQCVVNYYGGANLITAAAQQKKAMREKISTPRDSTKLDSAEMLLGGKVEERLGLARQASAVTYVSTNDPPVLTAHGTKDPLVPFEQAEEFHAKLLALKVPSVLITIKDAGHGFNSRLLNERVGSFFAKYLLSKGAEIKDEVIPLKP